MSVCACLCTAVKRMSTLRLNCYARTPLGNPVRVEGVDGQHMVISLVSPVVTGQAKQGPSRARTGSDAHLTLFILSVLCVRLCV